MKPALFYDTETTGLPLFSEPSEDPRQPHIVQLGAVLVDLDTRDELAVLDVVTLPDGWVIPDEVAAIHGITTERARLIGIPEKAALQLFLELWARASVRVAHNETFDARILRIAMKRFADPVDATFADPQVPVPSDVWKAGPSQCTQLLSTPILKLPPTAKMVAARRNHHKSANLGEAFEHFTGKKLEGAHSAIVDVRACMTVFWAIQDLQREAVAA